MPKPISLAQQIEEVEREIKLRESAFQSYGRAGKLRWHLIEAGIASATDNKATASRSLS